MTKRKLYKLCTRDGCRRAGMGDGSGFCYSHNPAQIEKQQEVRLKISYTIRMTVPPPESACKVEGCRKWAQKDSQGFCYQHNPAKKSKRQESGLKRLDTLKVSERSVENGCVVEGCKGYATRESGYCIGHSQNIGKAPGSNKFCSFAGCHKWAIKNGTGFCFGHEPTLHNKRQEIRSQQKNGWGLATRPRERKCAVEGCQTWTIRGWANCLFHNTFKPPAEKVCKVRNCARWARLDGSGLCPSHTPANMARSRVRMKGNKITSGMHLPYLGLKNIEEARGMIFYGLEMDKPLLVLRGLRKVASLHARGEMHMPKNVNPGQAQKDMEDYMNSFLNDVKYDQEE